MQTEINPERSLCAAALLRSRPWAAETNREPLLLRSKTSGGWPEGAGGEVCLCLFWFVFVYVCLVWFGLVWFGLFFLSLNILKPCVFCLQRKLGKDKVTFI